jgi:hypothetical protein
VISDHACRRYLERIDPTADPEVAIRLAMRTAVKLDRPARDGCAFWRCARFVLICLDLETERVVRTVIGLDRIERTQAPALVGRAPIRKVPPKPYRHPRR